MQSDKPWFARAESAWGRDWRLIGSVFCGSVRLLAGNSNTFLASFIAWFILRLPWMSLLPLEVFSQPYVGVVIWGNALGHHFAGAGICFFAFRHYINRNRGGGKSCRRDGWLRFLRVQPYVFGLYLLWWAITVAYAAALPLLKFFHLSGESWMAMVLTSKLEGLFVFFPLAWVICRTGGVLAAAAANDDSTLGRAWTLTAGHTRVLLYTSLIWYAVQRVIPDMVSFPLYNKMGRYLTEFDWLFWVFKFYGAVVTAIFIVVAAAWYVRLDSARKNTASSVEPSA